MRNRIQQPMNCWDIWIKLDTSFQNFAELDFPTEFDYLESLADEASAYMTQAVESYHEAYSNGGTIN